MNAVEELEQAYINGESRRVEVPAEADDATLETWMRRHVDDRNLAYKNRIENFSSQAHYLSARIRSLSEFEEVEERTKYVRIDPDEPDEVYQQVYMEDNASLGEIISEKLESFRF